MSSENQPVNSGDTAKPPSNTDNLEIDYQVFTDNYPNLLQLAWQSQASPDIVY